MTVLLVILKVLLVALAVVIGYAAHRLRREVSAPTDTTVGGIVLAVTSALTTVAVHPGVGLVLLVAAVMVTAIGLRRVDQTILETARARAATVVAETTDPERAGDARAPRPGGGARKPRKGARVQHQGRVTRRLD